VTTEAALQKALGSQRPRRSVVWRLAWYALPVVAFLACAVSIFWMPEPVYAGDRRVWGEIAREPLTSSAFWLGRRPFVVPLLHKLCGLDDTNVVPAQILLWVACWPVLALAVGTQFRHWFVRIGGVALILAFALSVPICQWNAIVRSESVALSLFALFGGLALLTWRYALPRAAAGRWRRVMLLTLTCLTAALWTFSRESNGYMVLTVALVAIFAAGLRRVRRAMYWWVLVAGGAALLAVFIASTANLKAAGRHFGPLTNVIFRRILTDPQRTQYFANRLGLPLDDALRARANTFVSDTGRLVEWAPEFVAYRAWANTVGPTRYAYFLLTHPAYSLGMWWEYCSDMNTHDGTVYGQGAGATGLTRVLGRALFSNGLVRAHPYGFTFICTLLAMLFALRGRGRQRAVGGLALFLVLNAALQAFLGVHGDAMETLRHGFMAPVLLRIAGFLLLLEVAESVAASLAARPNTAAKPDVPTHA